jgi:hypothetical protein
MVRGYETTKIFRRMIFQCGSKFGPMSQTKFQMGAKVRKIPVFSIMYVLGCSTL